MQPSSIVTVRQDVDPWAIAAPALRAVSISVPARKSRLDEQGMLEPYAPKGAEKLGARFLDKDTPPHWVGMGVYGTVVRTGAIHIGQAVSLIA